ncbi:MAG: adenylate/guanylate cyclase domain-containing protein [Bacteroidota bacterium]
MSDLPTGTVTFLFTDIEGSTRLWQEQPAAMRVAHERHDEILRTAIQSNHGYIFQIVGDSFSAAFHNALDGLNAALAAQQSLHQEVWGATGRIRVRMGLHTGTAQIRPDGNYDGYATLATAQRVMSVAHGGQVLLSPVVHELCCRNLPGGTSLLDLGEHRLKDIREVLRLYQLCAPDLPNEFPLLKSLLTLPNNLPVQLTSFVGREQQLAEGRDLLSRTRLLTLIGPGGTGKTRLSLQLAEDQLAAFPDGAWLIELAPLADAAYLNSTVLSTFHLQEVQGTPLRNTLIDYLRGKGLLLVLDNCEHLVDACARLAGQLLQECPGLKIIASSREALGIGGESVYRVPPLVEQEATRLFIERAQKADSRFQVTEANALSIAQVCSRLDGIPLAIELAAARVKLFSPQQIADRLDDRFKLLTGGSRTALPRQQTLRALIDWSYQTLNDVEQRAFRRLAVFSGGWTMEAAEAVAGDAEAFDGLAGLVNKSLVNVEEQHGGSRYSYLETVRQYALEKLVEAGEADETRSRHVNYMSGFVSQIIPDFYGLNADWLYRTDTEKDNLRAALEWSVDHNMEKAFQLVRRIGTYWSMRENISEAQYWYRTILQKSESIPAHEADRGAIYSLLGWTSILVGHHREGRLAAEKAAALARQFGGDRTLILSLCTLTLASVFLADLQAAQNAIQEAESAAREKGLKEELALVTSTRAQMIYFTTRDVATSKALLEEAIQLSSAVGYRWETAFQVFGQGRFAAILGDLEAARTKFNEATEIARQIGNKRMVYSNRSELAHLLREHGHLEEALEIYQEIIPGWQELGHRAALAHELECIGYILSRKEEPEKAVSLIATAQQLRKAIDTPRTGMEEAEYQKELARLKDMLSEDAFQTHQLEGENMPLETAIELALDV